MSKPPTDSELQAARRMMGAVERLDQFYTEREIQIWMLSPHPQLKGRLPINFFNTDAEVLEISEIIDRLETDAYI